MPDIDVTDVLLDADVAGEDFWVLRRSQRMGANGRPVLTKAWLPAFGSIQPVGDNSMAREEAFQTQAKTLEAITTFRLRGVSETREGVQYQPDLVYWNGDFYIGRTLNDYSKYGAGMVEYECTSIDMNDRPPELPPSPAPTQTDFALAANSGLAGNE